MCITGVGLAFERQVIVAADRASRSAVTPGPNRLPLDSLLSTTESPSAITFYSSPDEPVALAFGRERTVFVDPYTGRKLGENSRATRAFFATLERWHRALGSELRGRGPGRGIAGAANFLFLFLVTSGLVLWWPKKWTPQRLRSSALLRRNLSGRALLWNLHNVIGLWSALPLFFIVLSGVIMSYPWANNLLYRLAGSEPPAAVRPESHGARGHAHQLANSLPLTVLFERAQSQLPGWRSISLQWAPASADAVFTIDRGNGGQPTERGQLTLDKATGAIKKWETFASSPRGRQWRVLARFLHTGEALGLPGQIVAALATLGGVVLSITGLWMLYLRVRRAVTSAEARVELETVSSP
jgi:uncharacterized iron-regulated membrane protein